MATKISGMTAITAGAYDDTALSERVNNAGVTRKATVAQDRVALLVAGCITAGMIAGLTIVNADISATAAIVDTKLATISTAGKVSNSATTATSANTASAIVARDANGDFTMRHLTAVNGTFTGVATLGGAAVNNPVTIQSTDGQLFLITKNTAGTSKYGFYHSNGGADLTLWDAVTAAAIWTYSTGGNFAFSRPVTASSTVTVAGGFGCNTKAAQTAFASGGALNAYGAGVNGLDSGANMSALHALVVNIRAALVANGIMS